MQAIIAQTLDAFDRVPENSSFSISSNIRAAGTFSISAAISRMGARTAGSSVRPSLAEAHRAQHAHRILPVALLRLADHAQRLLLQVGDAMVIVDHRFGGRIVIQGVDGEVAARRIFGDRAETLSRRHGRVHP